MQKETRPAIERLLRGISTSHVETVRDAWREMLQDGPEAVIQSREKLSSRAWADNPRGPLARYFGVLLALIDELDPEAFEIEVARLRQSTLHPMHIRTLEVLSQRIGEIPAAYVQGDIPVYVSSEIADRSVVIGNIKTWSRTKNLSLQDVSRIDVVARHAGLDYLGLYNLFFSGIILTWPANRVRGVKLWWERLGAEFTFYHEVGHHVSGHIEGGQVAEQEKEADAYARLRMRNARPVLTCFARMVLLPLKPLLKLFLSSTDRKNIHES